MTTLEFSAMVQKYQSLVYTVCHQLVPDAGDAQDLTQETFLAAWRAIDRCPSGFEKQWLARIAANKAKDYLRSAWVRRVNIPGDDVLALEGAPPGTQPEQQVLDALGEEELTAMILDLREPYRTPCRLVLLEQHTMAEAAQLCGRPFKTVEAQIVPGKNHHTIGRCGSYGALQQLYVRLKCMGGIIQGIFRAVWHGYRYE